MKQAHLPTAIPRSLTVAAIFQGDKKVTAGQVRFLLPTGIGTPPRLEPVPAAVLAAALVANGATP